MYSSTLSLTSALDGGGWSTPRPGRFTPGKGTWYPLCRRLGEPQDRSKHVQKTSSPPGFDPRTVQPVASRYTDCAIPVQVTLLYFVLNPHCLQSPVCNRIHHKVPSYNLTFHISIEPDTPTRPTLSACPMTKLRRLISHLTYLVTLFGMKTRKIYTIYCV